MGNIKTISVGSDTTDRQRSVRGPDTSRSSSSKGLRPMASVTSAISMFELMIKIMRYLCRCARSGGRSGKSSRSSAVRSRPVFWSERQL
ncbi:uncharacterized protein LOC105827759 [Monomorium pharaonis]|uniref:uncharacterized protein LOC105827759 n=1 Tax=Monomorium pharaonis TaxID=307658 RepID=UPI001747D625|nr:uncharacterized protein LOC105827759 [Monomorium pharaonis]